MILTRATLHRGGRTADKGLFDLALRHGLIGAIAPGGTLTPEPGEEVIDLDGRLVIPGLWDEHVHMGQWASHLRRVDVSGAESATEALAMMAESASRGAADEVVVGAGMRPGTWTESPTLEMIDRASGCTPWVIFAIDIHSCWANTAALRRFGFLETPGGILTEHDSFALLGAVESVDVALHDQWVAEAEAQAASRGVVGIVDLDMGPTLDNWIRRRTGQEETFLLRVDASVYPDTLDTALSRGIKSGDAIAPGVTMGPLKAITDGSLNTRTAFVSTPYAGSEPHPEGHGEGDACGVLNYSLDDIDTFVAKASNAGIAVTLHAIGDRANTMMLDVFERHGIHGRIEHAQLVQPEDIARFARLGVTASVQPQHAVDDREVTDRFWFDRVERAFPLRSLLDSGADVVFGSDAPVSALDPWVQIAAAVTRTDDERPPWRGEQCVSVAQAIACSTRTTIEVGQPADLAVLDADPYWIAAALSNRPQELSRALRSMSVALTVVGGRVTHSGNRIGGDDGNRTRTISLED